MELLHICNYTFILFNLKFIKYTQGIFYVLCVCVTTCAYVRLRVCLSLYVCALFFIKDFFLENKNLPRHVSRSEHNKWWGFGGEGKGERRQNSSWEVMSLFNLFNWFNCQHYSFNWCRKWFKFIFCKILFTSDIRAAHSFANEGHGNKNWLVSSIPWLQWQISNGVSIRL